MKRIRALIIFLPLILFVKTPRFFPAPTEEPTIIWRPGLYSGLITIMTTERHFEELTQSDVCNHYTLNLGMDSGRMQILVGDYGNISYKFDVRAGYKYYDCSVMKPDDAGGCKGQISEAEGYAKLSLQSPMSLTQTGNKFYTEKSITFTPEHFYSGNITRVGPNCPAVRDEQDMRFSLEKGFRDMFKGKILEFEVLFAEDNIIEGTCTLPQWGNDPDHEFICFWRVVLVPQK
jgi:hypothetical protein